MTEVPGTDRDQARENVLAETPLVPEGVEDADDDPRGGGEAGDRGDDGRREDSVEPAPESTEPTT